MDPDQTQSPVRASGPFSEPVLCGHCGSNVIDSVEAVALGNRVEEARSIPLQVKKLVTYLHELSTSIGTV